MRSFQIKVVGKNTVFVFEKRPWMKPRDVLRTAGLEGYELRLEENDFVVYPDEYLDFVEDGQVLYAAKGEKEKGVDVPDGTAAEGIQGNTRETRPITEEGRDDSVHA